MQEACASCSAVPVPAQLEPVSDRGARSLPFLAAGPAFATRQLRHTWWRLRRRACLRWRLPR